MLHKDWSNDNCICQGSSQPPCYNPRWSRTHLLHFHSVNETIVYCLPTKWFGMGHILPVYADLFSSTRALMSYNQARRFLVLFHMWSTDRVMQTIQLDVSLGRARGKHSPIVWNEELVNSRSSKRGRAPDADAELPEFSEEQPPAKKASSSTYMSELEGEPRRLYRKCLNLNFWV